MQHWYQRSASQVLQELGSDPDVGLSDTESQRRLHTYGANALVEHPPKPVWKILWEQFTSTSVLVLIVAAFVSAILGDYRDAGAILAIVTFNALLGFSQEYQASQAFAALKKLVVPQMQVCRSGQWQKLPARQLVPGDLIRLEAGDIVPADCRLVESANLRVQEAVLTGESQPTNKDIAAIATSDLPLGDRSNMLYMGTVTAYGRAQAVVTETGMNTELGKVAHLVQSVETEPTPLQRRQEQLGRRLALIAFSLAGVIFLLGSLRNEALGLMIMTAVSMAVAIIPEGLPAVITITLALGARRMLQRQALIRKLPAVETLGSVTVICSDKTGTLTENRMTVTVIEVAGQRLELQPADPEPFQTADPLLATSFSLLLASGALCNDSILSQPDTAGPPMALGDPTEVALAVAAQRFGLNRQRLEAQFPRVGEFPFDSDRQCMTTIHHVRSASEGDPPLLPVALLSTPYVVFTKGALNRLLDCAGSVWVGNRVEALDVPWRDRILASHDQLAQQGMRVLGLGLRLWEHWPDARPVAEIEQDLVVIGLVGMEDPARPEVKAAVATCQQAGIRPMMITGDHPLTAQHIAHELGICAENGILTGQALAELPLSALKDQVSTISVYARVSPQQKLRIVEALQERGHIVAMTGDGVNDAPALRKADIGVAMGITGTDVAKEAADMVLLDDNFATIVAAVQEGRVIYDNIRKFIRYTLTGNASGVWIMLLSTPLAMPLPLLPLQILWINLLADGLMALALSVEPAERHVMQRPPYRPGESIFQRGVGRDIIWVGLVVGMAILGLGYGYWFLDQAHWQTMVFATLAFSRMSLALAMRSERDSLAQIGLLSNWPMLGAVALTLVLQLAVIYLPGLKDLFRTMPLSGRDLGISLLVSTVGFWGIEAEKWWMRQRRPHASPD
jgi:Ca2+-transporting ATPase